MAAARTIATAYGAAAHEALRDVVRAAKADDPLAPVTLLVPSNLAGIVARRYLASGLTESGNGVAGLTIATIPRLAEQIAAGSLAPRRPATGPVTAAAWRAALGAAPGVFEPVKEHPATIRALVSAHRQLRDLSPVALDSVAASSPLSGELVRLHQRVVASLSERSYDQTDLLRAATQIATGDQQAPSGALPAGLGTVVLYLPQQLSLAEAGLVRALADRLDLTVIVGLTRVVRADRVVHESLARIGVESPPATAATPTGTEVLHASDSDDEVRVVVREVVAALRTVPAHQVAVLYSAASPYARLLHEHLAAADITVNGAGTRPVVERALARGFLDVLALAESDLPRADFFAAVTEAPTRRDDGSRVPASRWERLSRLAAVVGADDWDTRLGDYARSERAAMAADLTADPDDPRARWHEDRARDADGLSTFATGLRERLRAGLRMSRWPELAGWAGDLFRDLYGGDEAMQRLPGEEQYAAAVVRTALAAAGDLDAFEPAADLDRLIDVLSLELESARPRVGRFGDGVLVAPLSDSVGLDAEVVFVVGLAEDTYPGRLAEDALLPDTARTASGGELGSFRDSLDARHRHLLAAFDVAPRVVASFPRGDLRRSTQRLPSQWLMPTLREIAGRQDVAATEWESVRSDRLRGSSSYASSLVGVALPVSEQEWRTQATATGRPFADDAIEAAEALLRARATDAFTRFDGNLSGASGLPDYAHSDERVAPTTLEGYASCPHSYFVQRLLRVRPVEQPEEIVAISPIEIGNLIHLTFDRFVKACGEALPGYGESWRPDQRTLLRRIAAETADEFEQRGLTGHRTLWQAERVRILADLDYLLDNDDERRAGRDARVLRSELGFGGPGEPPVEIAVDGGRVLMRGSADKVDQTRDGTLLVVDIKAGGPSRYRDIRSDPLGAGTHLQLPVYAQAALQLLKGERAEASYWLVRQGKRDWFPIVLDDDLNREFTRTVGVLTTAIADGLFPEKAPDVPDFRWVQCPYCNPDGLGHGDVRARWERKRHDPLLRPLVEIIDAAALDDNLEAGAR